MNRSRNLRIPLAAFACITALLAVARLVQPSRDTGWPLPAVVAFVLCWVLLTLVAGVAISRRRRSAWRLHHAVQQLEVERVATAREQIAEIAARTGYVNAATAQLALARDDERQGNLDDALASALAARRQIGSRTRQAATYDRLLPGIRAMTARMLAALGRESEALSELGLLERGHPVYARLESARRSVQLLVAVHRRDFELAARIARSRENEHAVSLRDEELGELARFESGEPFTRDRRQRLRREIDELPGLRRWLERVAPQAVAKI